MSAIRLQTVSQINVLVNDLMRRELAPPFNGKVSRNLTTMVPAGQIGRQDTHTTSSDVPQKATPSDELFLMSRADREESDATEKVGNDSAPVSNVSKCAGDEDRHDEASDWHAQQTRIVSPPRSGSLASGDSWLAERLCEKADASRIFELLMPDGDVLGVAVDVRPGSVGFLLSPSSKSMGKRLQGKERELKDGLERRMKSEVLVAVLP